MKRILYIAISAAFVCGCCGQKTRIGNDVLMDKIKGAWAGQVIGCTFGGPTEFKYQGRYIPDSVSIDWPDHYIKWWYENSPGLYDDVYMDLTFVDVFDKEGLDAPIESFANAFAYADYDLWHANLQARMNIFDGIMPPESGHWKNNPHADDIDFQIESDFSGIMAPGMPCAAARYGDAIGHMMNYGDGWYGGVFVGAMYSLAFVNDDINAIIAGALEMLPKESRYYKCISDVIKWHEQNPDDWHMTWQLLQDNYTGDVGCIDEPWHDFIIDATLNGAYITVGLLYGQGDFEKSMEIACRCGQDSDCNPSSAAGILGTMIGYSNIPEKWMAQVREVEDMNFKYTDISLDKVYEMSFDQACKVIAREGGKVSEGNVAIKVQKPQPVRLEQSFEGLELKEVYDFPQPRPYDADIVHTFNGTSVILKGHVQNREFKDAYDCEIEVTIDGKPYGTTVLKDLTGKCQDHIFHTYTLEPGEHTVVAHIVNPREDMPLLCTRALVYGPK